MTIQEQLLARAKDGDSDAIGALLATERERLRRMVALRLDPRLRGRVDVSDVVQDSMLEASQRLPQYFEDPSMPFVVWLRFLAAQRIVTLQRRHLGAQARDAGREVDARVERVPEADCSSIADVLIAEQTSPTKAARRAETCARVEAALRNMDSRDREILVLRHFEHLSNEEAARELSIETSAASKRFLRALKRMREILGELEGELSE